jgi:hypothetical protein
VALLMASLVVTMVPASAHTGGSRWDCLAHYESTHRWKVSTGNGHYGGLQFSHSTWRYYGGPNYSKNYWPHKATDRDRQAGRLPRLEEPGSPGRPQRLAEHLAQVRLTRSPLPGDHRPLLVAVRRP